MSRKVLHKARDAHSARTGHKRIFCGFNFVECLDCGKHAHLTSDGKRLIIHAVDYKHVGTVGAEDF